MLLVDIDMPEDCQFCPMSYWYGGTGELAGCAVVNGKEYAISNDAEFASKGRPSWCPIKGEFKEGNEE